MIPPPVHPLGSSATILLTSVFGPYARDDEYGSRALNPMELYQNQVTRAEGPFSLRMFHRSWGIMLIQANLSAPCTLLELIEEHGKSWSLYVFSSARVVQSYSIEQLVRLGISWVWMGLEGKNSRYAKLSGVDTRELVRTLQSHGIRVLGSSIIGLEDHTPENLDEAIEYAVSHATDFHQFMLYTPIPGTPLYAEHLAKGTLRDSREYQEGDIHGQEVFRHRHPHLQPGQETAFIQKAFRRDFEVNGPSVLRIARTVLSGWRRYKHHTDARIRDRFAWEARDLAVTFPATLWAARRWFAERNPLVFQKLSALLEDIKQEVGLKSKLIAPLAGRVVWSKLRQEAARLKAGWTYEPPTFYEANAPMLSHRRTEPLPKLIRWVSPRGQEA